MQLSLKPVEFPVIKPLFEDFIRKTKSREFPPREAQAVGIYGDDILCGYFILVSYTDGDLEINQGYLAKEYRHKNLSRQAMVLLEQTATVSGYKRIILASSRSLKAYTIFMAGMGYKPERIIFSKEL